MPSDNLFPGISKFVLPMFMNRIYIDEMISQTSDWDAGTVSEKSDNLFSPLFFSVALQCFIVDSELQ